MNIKNDIYLNQLSQGIVSKSNGLRWFCELPSEFQVEMLRRLVYFILQMGGSGSDVKEAIELSGLKKTYTPCQLLLKVAENSVGRKALSINLTKIIGLPKSERKRSFELLLSLASISDKKKRDKGISPDRYWWHRDLSKQEVIDAIVKEFS